MWALVAQITGKDIIFDNHMCDGFWLEFQGVGSAKYMASIIVAGIWSVWKARCDCIFNNKVPNFSWMARRILDQMKDF